jgi:hypothetical protein
MLRTAVSRSSKLFIARKLSAAQRGVALLRRLLLRGERLLAKCEGRTTSLFLKPATA